MTKDCVLCGRPFRVKPCYYHEAKCCSRRCSSARLGSVMHENGKSNRDANHQEIVSVLEEIGALVLDSSVLGGGFPDLIVIYQGQTKLLEIKNLKTSYGRRGLTKTQRAFHANWPAPIHIVHTPDEAMRAVAEAARPRAGDSEVRGE